MVGARVSTMVAVAGAALAFATAAPAASLLVAQGSEGVVDYQLDAAGVPSLWSAQDATFNARRVVFSADGTRVFAASGTGDHATEVVRSYTRNPATGALTLVSSVGLGGTQLNPCSLALAPDGGHLYVTACGNGSNAGVSAYAIGVNGSLTAFAAGTFAVASYNLTDGLISPDGRSLYLGGQLYGSKILQYDIADGGAVTAKATPVVDGGMDYMAITPNGRYLYGWGTGQTAVLGFPIIAETGALGTALTPVSTSPAAELFATISLVRNQADRREQLRGPHIQPRRRRYRDPGGHGVVHAFRRGRTRRVADRHSSLRVELSKLRLRLRGPTAAANRHLHRRPRRAHAAVVAVHAGCDLRVPGTRSQSRAAARRGVHRGRQRRVGSADCVRRHRLDRARGGSRDLRVGLRGRHDRHERDEHGEPCIRRPGYVYRLAHGDQHCGMPRRHWRRLERPPVLLRERVECRRDTDDHGCGARCDGHGLQARASHDEANSDSAC
jgi:hypothetical protein